jgi:hypothetical protein
MRSSHATHFIFGSFLLCLLDCKLLWVITTQRRNARSNYAQEENLLEHRRVSVLAHVPHLILTIGLNAINYRLAAAVGPQGKDGHYQNSLQS